MRKTAPKPIQLFAETLISYGLKSLFGVKSIKKLVEGTQVTLYWIARGNTGVSPQQAFSRRRWRRTSAAIQHGEQKKRPACACTALGED